MRISVDHLQIMLCCLNPDFMADDVCFILIKHGTRVNIFLNIFLVRAVSDWKKSCVSKEGYSWYPSPAAASLLGLPIKALGVGSVPILQCGFTAG